MIIKVPREQAAAGRQKYVTPSGTLTFVSTYIGTNKMELAAQGKSGGAAVAEPDADYPMAYLVEQAPDSTVEPHYHQVDQFQLFVGGGGHIGTHTLEGVAVHYAGAHSPYGPIVSGPEGVHYVTLRRSWDPGAQWMPGAAPALRNMPDRKHVAHTSEPLQRWPEPQLAQLEGASSTEVLPPQPNGMGAWAVRAGPGAAVRVDPSAGNGQFWYVLSGTVQAREARLGPGACIFVSADEEPIEFSVAEAGAELVLMQFPRA